MVVLRDKADGPETVQAKTRATSVNLAGQRKTIRLPEATADGYISYVGTYRYLLREVLDFDIQAQPAGTKEDLRWNTGSAWDRNDECRRPQSRHFQ